MRLRILLVLSALSSASCVTARATAFEVPKERATECASVCQNLGMQLSAMVVIMSSAGCVCEPVRAPGEKQAGASAAAGGALIAAELAAEQAQQQQAPQPP